MKFPLISVIVPVYKVEDYIEECILSIITQRYKNFELILVDDGSPDRCPEICEEWGKRDKRIKVVHKRNGGLSDARNCGMEVAIGDYIWFVDSDDWLEEGAFDILIEVLMKHPSVDLVHFLLLENKPGYDVRIYNKIVEKTSTSLLKKEYVEKRIPLFPVMQFVIKRDVLVRYKLVFIKGVLHEDIPFGHMLIYHVKEVYWISKPLYNYRIRESSITTTSNIKSCYSLMKSYQIEKTFVADCVNKDDKVWYDSLFYDYLHEIFIRIYPFLDKVEYRKFMGEYGDYIKREFGDLASALKGKRLLLLYLFKFSPKLYSRLIYIKKNGLWKSQLT